MKNIFKQNNLFRRYYTMKSLNINKRDKIVGALYGFVIGDALGAVTEYLTKEEINEAVKKASEAAEVSTINESYDTKFENYVNELIDKRIKEKLVLDERSEPYSGSYATLNYGEENLGYVCLKAYHDD